MASTFRLSIRTGIVGAWASFVGVALILLVGRVLHVLDGGTKSDPSALARAGVPIGALLTSAAMGLYNGGSVSILLGIVLVAAGWYQVLSLA